MVDRICDVLWQMFLLFPFESLEFCHVSKEDPQEDLYQMTNRAFEKYVAQDKLKFVFEPSGANPLPFLSINFMNRIDGLGSVARTSSGCS